MRLRTTIIVGLGFFGLLAAAALVNQVAMVQMAKQVAKAEQSLTKKRVALYLERSKAHELKTRLVYSERLRKAQEEARVRVLTVTAYSSEVNQTDDTPFVTATNKRVRPGIVAVSRDLFRKGWVFGRKVYIKGHGIFTIDDLMHPRKKNQIDIYMGNTGDAVQFGRRTLEVFLVDT